MKLPVNNNKNVNSDKNVNHNNNDNDNNKMHSHFGITHEPSDEFKIDIESDDEYYSEDENEDGFTPIDKHKKHVDANSNSNNEKGENIANTKINSITDKETNSNTNLNTEDNKKIDSVSSNSNNKEQKQEEPLLEEDDSDPQVIAHRIYYKGSEIDIRDHNICKLKKIKSKSGIMSIFSKKQVEKEYLAFFDENFIYFLKDVYNNNNKENNNINKYIRKVGNKYNLKLLQNAEINVNY